MPRPYLFLDLHGVLFPRGAVETDPPFPLAIRRLNRITQATGALIVISSAWRFYFTLGQIQVLLHGLGVKAPVVGMVSRDSDDRGQMICNWLCNWVDVDADFVVLDDHVWDMEMLAGHVVKVDGEKGLGTRDVKLAVKILEDGRC